MNCSMPGFLVLLYLLEFAQNFIHWVSDAIQPSHPLSLPSLLPSVFPSIGVFSKQLALCIRCPKYWSFNFSISLSREYSGLISFGIDWFDLLAVQRDSQERCPASILWCSAFFTAWLSHLHDYWKNHSLTIQTSVGQVISLVFNILFTFIIAFLQRSKCLLIS